MIIAYKHCTYCSRAESKYPQVFQGLLLYGGKMNDALLPSTFCISQVFCDQHYFYSMFTLIKNQLTDSSQRHPSAKNVISFHLFFTSFFLALPSAVL